MLTFYKDDPVKSPGDGNNNIDELMDPKGGTTPLMMGASFAAPPPFHSLDRIKKFNATDAAAEDVFDADEAKPKFPTTVQTSMDSWTSAQPVADSSNAAAPWDDALKHWQNPELTVPLDDGTTGLHDMVTAAIGAWSSVFGWDADSNVIVPENQVKVADGNNPIIWDRFTELYMAPPMVGVQS